MARYTCSFTVVAPFDRLRQLLVEVLQTYEFEIIYGTNDYIMARELPGQVPFAKLVTVEVLFDRPANSELAARNGNTDTETQMNFVIKNEELPLQVDNHCHQLFEQIYQALANNRHWQLVESIA